MSEFEIIRNHFSRDYNRSDIDVGIGDDGAILNIDQMIDSQLVVSTDTIVEQTHFPEGTVPGNIARRAMCINLSDMAAMGALPLWFTLSLTLPGDKANEEWLSKFSSGLFEIASRYSCGLIGGDTTKGPLSVTICIFGNLPSDAGLKRSSASVGDIIYLSGSIGASRAALELLSKNKNVSERLLRIFYEPTPMIDLGIKLRNIATSCIDVSDGLVADLNHICRASRVSAKIHLATLPFDEEVKSLFPDKYIEFGLSGGDDYQLCFTVPKHLKESIESISTQTGITLTAIGEIVEFDHTQSITINGFEDQLNLGGYDHFD